MSQPPKVAPPALHYAKRPMPDEDGTDVLEAFVVALSGNVFGALVHYDTSAGHEEANLAEHHKVRVVLWESTETLQPRLVSVLTAEFGLPVDEAEAIAHSAVDRLQKEAEAEVAKKAAAEKAEAEKAEAEKAAAEKEAAAKAEAAKKAQAAHAAAPAHPPAPTRPPAPPARHA